MWQSVTRIPSQDLVLIYPTPPPLQKMKHLNCSCLQNVCYEGWIVKCLTDLVVINAHRIAASANYKHEVQLQREKTLSQLCNDTQNLIKQMKSSSYSLLASVDGMDKYKKGKEIGR